MNIKAFAAMEPDQQWYNIQMNNTTNGNSLQGSLEPKNEFIDNTNQCKTNLEQLLKKQNYTQSEVPGIYIYEKETASSSQLGVWVLTSLDDFHKGKILTHERTLASQERKLKDYRTKFGLEGSPVILTYRRQQDICALIEKAAALQPLIEYSQENQYHRVWKLTEPAITEAFLRAFARINRVYVADGHHRLAAANAPQVRPQWISTLYISSGQLRCREFHRMITCRQGYPKEQLFKELEKHFCISPVPNNVPYRPNRLHRFGMHFQNRWYQLDLKPDCSSLNAISDPQLLQELILEPAFGISSPETDKRLHHIAAGQWSVLISEIAKRKNTISFTVFPMTPDALICEAEKGSNLPPKSTSIEPKVPFGLLLYHNKEATYHIEQTQQI